MENTVAQRRVQHGWSQWTLADRLGVSRQSVISIERGRYSPSLPLAFKLAQLFDCRIEDLFTPEPWQPQRR